MKMPKAPDPYATAAAQSQMNKETAVAQAGLNSTNQYTPDGSLVYDQIGKWEDGTPRFSVTQTLSPENQKLYDLDAQTSANLGQIGVDQSKRMGDLLANPLSFSGIGKMPTGPQSGDFTSYLAPATEIGSSTVGMRANPNAIMVDRQSIADNQAVEGRLIELGSRRLSPELQRRRLDLDASLADKGISANSDGYSRAMNDNAQAENDAWTSLILNGQGQAFSQAATRASNDFGQDLARTGQYWTQAATKAQNEFGQDLAANNQSFLQRLGARQQFFNEGQAFNEARRTDFDSAYAREQQGYENAMRGRQQTIDEMLAERNQPINELGALMSGSQVSKPTWTSTPQTSIQPTDLISLVNNQYQAKMQGYGGMLSALGSVAGSIGRVATSSDERLKTDIKPVGRLDNGLTVYSYRYRSGGPIHIGVMAQEVERVRPDAVHVMDSGFLAVDYAKATEAA